MMSESGFEAARLKYKPPHIRHLLVAEAPPADNRFFYFEAVSRADYLFLETMRAIYSEFASAAAHRIRSQKARLLEKFKADGFYLIDVLPKPVPSKLRPASRRALLESRVGALASQLRNLCEDMTGIVLISSVVHEACHARLETEGFNVANDGPIKFPANGWQKEYRAGLHKALVRCGWSPQ